MDDRDDDWQQPYADRAAEIASDLSSLVESMNELIVDHLRTALDQGVPGRPPLDKDLQSARRSIERAIRSLGGA